MAATPSTMMPLGTTAPLFTLPDTVSGSELTLKAGLPVTVIAFICNHCPYVVHIAEELVALGNEVVAKGGQMIAISSNDVADYPQDSPENMTKFAEHYGMAFPYLYDESQDVAKSYDAACTPDFYVFDASLACVYRGRFDAATPGNSNPVNGAELRAAVSAVLGGQTANADQIPSIGCNIKWK